VPIFRAKGQRSGKQDGRTMCWHWADIVFYLMTPVERRINCQTGVSWSSFVLLQVRNVDEPGEKISTELDLLFQPMAVARSP